MKRIKRSKNKRQNRGTSPQKALLMVFLVLSITLFYESAKFHHYVNGVAFKQNLTGEKEENGLMEHLWHQSRILFWNQLLLVAEGMEEVKVWIGLAKLQEEEATLVSQWSESPLVFQTLSFQNLAQNSSSPKAVPVEKTLVNRLGDKDVTSDQSGEEASLFSAEDQSNDSTSFVQETDVKDSSHRILIVGDSMIGSLLGVSLERTLMGIPNSKVYRKGVTSTGLSRPDYYDWPDKLQKLIKQHRANVILVMIGTNDINALYSPETKKFTGFEHKTFAEKYRKNTAEFMQIMEDRKIPTFWLGLPRTEKESLNQRLVEVNHMHEEVAQPFSYVHYIKTWDLFSDRNNKLKRFIRTKKGKSLRIRENDGVHFNAVGGRQVSQYVKGKMSQTLDFSFSKKREKREIVAQKKSQKENAKNDLNKNMLLDKGRIPLFEFESQFLKQEIPFFAFLPKKKPEKRWPVLLLLHGYNGSHQDWKKRAGKSLLDLAEKHQMIIVTPTAGTHSWYLDSPLEGKKLAASYITQELLPYLHQQLPTNGIQSITGVSMGGHGAFTLAVKHPNLFVSASSMSGILDITAHPKRWKLDRILGKWNSKNAAIWQKNSALRWLEANPTFAEKTPLYFSVGKKDSWAFLDNRRFKKFLDEQGVTYHYSESKRIGHEWRLWIKELPKHVAWHDLFFKSETESLENVLVQAVQNNYQRLVEELLKKGVDLNTFFDKKKTPLMFAVQQGNFSMVKRLVDAGAKVNTLDEEEQSPLMLAAKGKSFPILKFLLQEGASVNLRDQEDHSALFYAARYRRKKHVDLLLEYGADVSFYEVDAGNAKKTFLTEIVEKGYASLAKRLIEEGADTNVLDEDQWSLLMKASYRGHTEVAQVLIDHSADIHTVDLKRRTALMIASWRGKHEMIKLLLKHGAKIDGKDKMGESALTKAAKYNQILVIKELLKNGANLEIRDRTRKTPLLIAAKEDRYKATQFLLEQGADIRARDRSGWTALFYASEGGSTKLIQLLLAQGAGVDTRSPTQKTPLMIATGQGYRGLTKLFLKHGAQINAVDVKGYSSLVYSSLYGHLQLARELVEQGADVNVKDKDGYTPLMFSVDQGDLSLTRLILEKELNVDEQDQYGETALFKASLTGNTKLIDFLLSSGAAINIASKQGKTPLQLVKEEKFQEAETLLTTIFYQDQGDEAFQQGDFEEAVQAYGISLKRQKQRKNQQIRQIARLYQRMGKAEYRLGRYESALQHYHQSLALRKKLNLTTEMSETSESLSELYYAEEDYLQAITYLFESFSLGERFLKKQEILENSSFNIENSLFLTTVLSRKGIDEDYVSLVKEHIPALIYGSTKAEEMIQINLTGKGAQSQSLLIEKTTQDLDYLNLSLFQELEHPFPKNLRGKKRLLKTERYIGIPDFATIQGYQLASSTPTQEHTKQLSKILYDLLVYPSFNRLVYPSFNPLEEKKEIVLLFN